MWARNPGHGCRYRGPPEDRMGAVLEKLREYKSIGVPNIWLSDPQFERISEFRDGSLHEAGYCLTAGSDPRAEILRAEIFA